MSKSIFKTEKVPFEFAGEKFIADVQRVYIPSAAINAYRQLMNGLPGMQELFARAGDLSQYQVQIDAAQAAALAAGKSEEEASTEVMASIGADAIKFMSEFAAEQNAIEAAHADAIFQAKLDVLVPALRGWDIADAELKLPEADADKKVLLQTYGALGEVVVEALWNWYRPTTASSEAGEKTTPKADSTTPRSSMPATENSGALPLSSSTTR